MTEGHHNLSHHDKRPEKIAQLGRLELELMKAYRDLLAKLKKSKEEGETLLDRTMVLFGSHMGNAATHSVTNVPVMLAGGGFKHGQHLAFDRPTTRRFATCTCRSYNGWGWRRERSGPARARSKGWKCRKMTDLDNHRRASSSPSRVRHISNLFGLRTDACRGV